MAIDVGPARGELNPLVQRVDHRHADDEHEEGLDQIPEVEAIPRVVRELAGQATCKGVVPGIGVEVAVEACGSTDQKKHGGATEKIEREKPLAAVLLGGSLSGQYFIWRGGFH